MVAATTITKALCGRVGAMFVASALLFCISAPVRANDAAETAAAPAEQVESAGKPVALNKFTKRKRVAKAARAQKPRVIAKGYRRKALEAAAIPMNENENDPAAISESVANANAQWPAPDTSVQPVTATPASTQPATPGVIGSDQLNELDKSVSDAPKGDDAASQIATKMAAQVAQNSSQAAGVNVPTTATPAMSAMASADKPEVASTDNGAWDQSSLIGKIFIAFGGLLTIASAARMFMA